MTGEPRYMVVCFDVSGLTEAEQGRLAMEVSVQAEATEADETHDGKPDVPAPTISFQEDCAGLVPPRRSEAFQVGDREPDFSPEFKGYIRDGQRAMELHPDFNAHEDVQMIAADMIASILHAVFNAENDGTTATDYEVDDLLARARRGYEGDLEERYA
jgi:hypothetical protein